MSAVTRVRDERKRTWYWVDDEFIDHHARHLTPAAQGLYQFYARHADRAGFSNFSRKDKAEALGVSETTIRNADKELTEKGYIRIEPKMRENGSQSNNHVYVLPLGDQLPQVAPGQILVGGQNPHPLKESSVVVSSQSISESESDTTTTEIPSRGSKSGGGSEFDPPPPTDTAPNAPDPVADLLADWETCGVAGEYLHPIAERILARPAWRDEVDDLLDYWQTWNQRVPDRPLGPAWLAGELRRLSTLSQNTERQHRWCDYLPPEPARPEYWQPYAGPIEPPTPDPEPTSPAAVLWQQALDELALTMPAPTFDVALRPIRAAALDGDTLTLQVRDGWQTWLTRLDRDIRRALARVSNRPLTFRVEVATPPQTAREERAA